MAFARRRFRGRPMQRRGRMKWTATHDAGESVGIGVLDEGPLVVSSDYAGNVNVSPSGVTLVRTVGMLSIGVTFAAPSGLYRLAWGIAHIEDDEVAAAGGAFDPAVSAQLIEERWLWTGSIAFNYLTQTSLVIPPIPFDVKQKVRLRNSGISFFFKGSTANAGTVLVTFTGRSLLRGDIS